MCRILYLPTCCFHKASLSFCPFATFTERRTAGRTHLGCLRLSARWHRSYACAAPRLAWRLTPPALVRSVPTRAAPHLLRNSHSPAGGGMALCNSRALFAYAAKHAATPALAVTARGILCAVRSTSAAKHLSPCTRLPHTNAGASPPILRIAQRRYRFMRILVRSYTASYAYVHIKTSWRCGKYKQDDGRKEADGAAGADAAWRGALKPQAPFGRPQPWLPVRTPRVCITAGPLRAWHHMHYKTS